ncbi:hypothetical protein LIER_23697 [Lithospermum erythrorhizon]|uniref:S1 motif domain-containing protein n=1 Tax=Lithospermum erythrorhizon TaxID=34254 RepID=A0AAV3R450_LITER
MENLTVVNTSVCDFGVPFSVLCQRRSRSVAFGRKQRSFKVCGSKDEPVFDQWDQMELKFGRMIGEDPKLTMAKIKGRKLNPDMSYLEIEKAYGKKVSDIEEVPFDVSDKRSSKSSNGLNLVRHVPKKGVKFEVDNKSNGLNLVRPVLKKGVKFEVDNKQKEQDLKRENKPAMKSGDYGKASVPNVILRKPTVFGGDDVVEERFARLRMQPNLSLNMGRGIQKERFTDITLLKRPELTMKPDHVEDTSQLGDVITRVSDEIADNNMKETPVSNEMNIDLALLRKPNSSSEEVEHTEDHSIKITRDDNISDSIDSLGAAMSDGEPLAEVNEERVAEENDSAKGVQSSNMQYTQESLNSNISSVNIESNPGIATEAALLGKPKRFDQPVRETPYSSREEKIPVTVESHVNPVELANFLATSPIEEHEDGDWSRVEDLAKTGGREEVELISSSTRGFVVSFGSLVGFLPYRNLSAKWKFLAFESWMRSKGLDPAMYRQNLSVIGSIESTSKNVSPESSQDEPLTIKAEEAISPDMELEELLKIYDQEKLKFLSSFIGQKVKVNVVVADRKTRKLIFSIRPKETEEVVNKKRSVMARLNVGDVVKCQIKKITYFGIFVEVEGVPALIHQSEVSWDATLDPSSYFKIGQVVEAKVHQLDFSVERIFLSLKEIMPDPLMEALEAVVGDHDYMDGRLEAAQSDEEWAEVESLILELQQFEGIQSVSKGRYFLSPGLAPTFQVYMAAMFEDQYKLLARSGNRIQEVIVQTSLGKEEIKSAILTCTNRMV